MTQRQMVLGAIFTIFIGMTASAAWADFVADQFMTISRPDNDGFLPSRIYTQGKKTRIEMDMAGRKAINISRGDKKPPVFWTLMPDEKMYMEATGDQGPTPLPTQKPGEKIEKTFVSKETLDGHPCNKFKITWAGPAGKKSGGFAWEATDLNDTPIRQELFNGEEHILIQLKNIEIKKLDPDLFELPAGYKKLSMPSGAPGMSSPPPASLRH